MLTHAPGETMVISVTFIMSGFEKGNFLVTVTVCTPEESLAARDKIDQCRMRG
jgi:hypothetical protein